MQPCSRRDVIIVAGLGILLLAGCGDGIHRVDITGMLTSQGKPVDGAVVQLLPKGGTTGDGGLGAADSDGKFTVISSRRDDPGIPPGTYTVRISRMLDPGGTLLPPDATQADYPDGFDSVPPPYSTPNSPLEITVTDETEEFKIDIPVALRTSMRR